MIERPEKTDSYMFEMVHQLLQRLHFSESLNLAIINEFPVPVCMKINGIKVRPTSYGESFHIMYLCSLILVELQFDMGSTPSRIAEWPCSAKNAYYACATDNVWRKFHQQCHVKSLSRLCILCIRNSMCSLDDESFLDLPVPPRIRRLLTYRDVAEVIYEEWSHGPTGDNFQ